MMMLAGTLATSHVIAAPPPDVVEAPVEVSLFVPLLRSFFLSTLIFEANHYREGVACCLKSHPLTVLC